jgi:hypothetical protein
MYKITTEFGLSNGKANLQRASHAAVVGGGPANGGDIKGA